MLCDIEILNSIYEYLNRKEGLVCSWKCVFEEIKKVKKLKIKQMHLAEHLSQLPEVNGSKIQFYKRKRSYYLYIKPKDCTEVVLERLRILFSKECHPTTALEVRTTYEQVYGSKLCVVDATLLTMFNINSKRAFKKDSRLSLLESVSIRNNPGLDIEVPQHISTEEVTHDVSIFNNPLEHLKKTDSKFSDSRSQAAVDFKNLVKQNNQQFNPVDWVMYDRCSFEIQPLWYSENRPSYIHDFPWTFNPAQTTVDFTDIFKELF